MPCTVFFETCENRKRRVMMYKDYEDLVERLREAPNDWYDADLHYEAADAIEELICEVADEHNARLDAEERQRWIPATERLPEAPYGCLAVVWDNPRYGDGDMFLNYYPEFVGFDGTWNDADGEEIPFDVVYWMRLPQIPEPPKDGEV